MVLAMLELKHGTHARFVKCKKRAREALYWPEMSAPIDEIVIDRITCHDYAPAEQKNSKSCPRSTLGKSCVRHTGLRRRTIPGTSWLLFWENWGKLKDLTSLETIGALKEDVSRHGIRAKPVTGCGVQYSSKEFESFAKSSSFDHVLESTKNPLANESAEAAVKNG